MTELAELLADCEIRGIGLLAADDGGLTIDAPQDALTPNMMGRLKAHKAELLAVLSRAGGRDGATRPDGWPVGSVEPPPACSQCGSLVLWETLAGNWRCLHCDPPVVALRALESVARIRRRHGITGPCGAAGMLGELKRMAR